VDRLPAILPRTHLILVAPRVRPSKGRQELSMGPPAARPLPDRPRLSSWRLTASC
jgi:hypothetical protein